MENIEKAIGRVRAFITELQFVEQIYFDGLVENLGLTDEGKDWLFDFLFNENDSATFEDYLAKYNVTFGQLK